MYCGGGGGSVCEGEEVVCVWGGEVVEQHISVDLSAQNKTKLTKLN
jgi:hypothetical protein